MESPLRGWYAAEGDSIGAVAGDERPRGVWRCLIDRNGSDWIAAGASRSRPAATMTPLA